MFFKRLFRHGLLTFLLYSGVLSLYLISGSQPAPRPFLWGVAVCEYQNSGAETCKNAQWASWEQKRGKIRHGHQSGKSCEFWDRYRDDVTLVKEMGLNAIRFSVEWSMIEPEPGVFDEAALKHYSDLVDAALEVGITPMATLHHFTHPQWFEDKGAFENESNIIYFVRFCQKVFERLNDRVPLWCTINEPGVYAFQGYIRGVFPPGKTSSSLAGKVLVNLLKAHVEVYKTLKGMRGGQEAQIGIVHQHMLFEPYHEDSALEKNFCWYLSQLMSTAVFDFFKTGIFTYRVIPVVDCFLGGFSLSPFSQTIMYEDATACKALDFIGLNYYSHVLINWKSPAKPAYREGDIVTDMYYAAYPEGLYRAIAEMSELKVPVYITENGIADSRDDRRAQFIESYLIAMQKAIEDGYDVRGYFYWTLMDNFEWDEGFGMKFGLCSVDYQTQERSVREGAHALLNVAHSA